MSLASSHLCLLPKYLLTVDVDGGICVGQAHHTYEFLPVMMKHGTIVQILGYKMTIRSTVLTPATAQPQPLVDTVVWVQKSGLMSVSALTLMQRVPLVAQAVELF